MKWKPIDSSECPKCFCRDAKVLSKSKKPNLYFDGEAVRCTNCGHDGEIQVEDSECADVFWYDYES